MEFKNKPTETHRPAQTERRSPKVKVIVLPANNTEVTIKTEDKEWVRNNELQHRPRKGFSYDGPGGGYKGF